ncbi:MAG TPA: selenide, water dikinase SelD, partial [Thermoanaerobaculia bacterium]|nr:selenide, water dikinase SelD [Thermoanaerobaculia bacterium]
MKLLGALPRVRDPRALVGFEASDDAAVFRLGEAGDADAECLLATTDFFTPVVDSPFDFGRVAAANALSDVWAMGGEPLFALNLVGFPVKALPMEVLGEILAGGAAVAGDAGIPILGGHSTDFDVPVYGMAVTGRVKASRLRRNVGARPGDALVLTKALGTGILTSALRARVLREGSIRALLGRGEGPTPEEEAGAVASMDAVTLRVSGVP